MSLASRPVRTRFDQLLSLPAAVRIGGKPKRLKLTATRVAWLRTLATRERMSRREIAAALGGVHAITYRTYVPLIEHGLIDGQFRREWTFCLTAKGRALLTRNAPLSKARIPGRAAAAMLHQPPEPMRRLGVSTP